jgi:diguanylate cyclase (GGDEF)-like protein
MSEFKKKQKSKILLDVFLILLVNVVFFLVGGNHAAHKLVQAYQLEAFIPFAFLLLLSIVYYSLRRCRELVSFNASIESRITKDPLTQLYHRRALEFMLLQEWQRFERYKEPFSLIMIHIDDFKCINDRFNHQEGNRVIIEISEKLLNSIRKTDFCARWSGTEFLILCPVSELSAITALAERLRADVYCLLKGGVELSLSLAVSEANIEKSLEELLKKVELQLYQAKNTGGNQVISG